MVYMTVQLGWIQQAHLTNRKFFWWIRNYPENVPFDIHIKVLLMYFQYISRRLVRNQPKSGTTIWHLKMLKIVLSLCLAIVAQSMETVSAGCVCAKTAVSVRSGASTSYSRLGTVNSGSCLILKSTSGRRNQGYYWRNVDYRGQVSFTIELGWFLKNEYNVV